MEAPNKRVPATVCGAALLCLMAASLLSTGCPTRRVSAQGVHTVDFERDIQPLLKESCYGCHGPTQQQGGFRFDQRSSVRKGPGRLRPGSSATSSIYLRLIGTDLGPLMPPAGALSAGQISLVKDWIDQGAAWPDELAGDDPPPPSPDPTAARLIEALRKDRKLFAAILREKPEAINRRAAGGVTPLMYAASYGDATAVELLLDRGADPNAANDAGATALMWAAGDAHITRVLLDHGADPNARSPEGPSPLSIAAGRFGNSAVVKLLLDHGASPNPPVVRSRGGRMSVASVALLQAANAGDELVFRMLVQHGAELKTAGRSGLVRAARSDCRGCVELLLGALDKADLNYALLGLAPFGDTALLTALIDRGADVDAVVPDARIDMRGRTPLMLAASSDRIPIDTVKMLLDRGADINVRGPEGETALDLAVRNGHTIVVDALLAAGAKAGRGFPTAQVTPKPAASAGAALERILPLLQKSDATFTKKAGCVSCHNNTLTAMTLASARAYRLTFDEAAAGAQRKTMASLAEAMRESILLGTDEGDKPYHILLALAAAGYAPDMTADALAFFIKGRQMKDGRWRNFGIDHRPPIQAGDVDVTAAAIRGLRVYAPQQQRAAYDDAVQRGLRWLLAAEPKTTDERAFQLLGLVWGGINSKHARLRAAARARSSRNNEATEAGRSSRRSPATRMPRARRWSRWNRPGRPRDRSRVSARCPVSPQHTTRRWVVVCADPLACVSTVLRERLSSRSGPVDLHCGEQLGRDGACTRHIIETIREQVTQLMQPTGKSWRRNTMMAEIANARRRALRSICPSLAGDRRRFRCTVHCLCQEIAVNPMMSMKLSRAG